MNAVAPIGGSPCADLRAGRCQRSGQPEGLIEKFGLSASHIVEKVKSLVK